MTNAAREARIEKIGILAQRRTRRRGAMLALDVVMADLTREWQWGSYSREEYEDRKAAVVSRFVELSAEVG